MMIVFLSVHLTWLYGIVFKYKYLEQQYFNSAKSQYTAVGLHGSHIQTFLISVVSYLEKKNKKTYQETPQQIQAFGFCCYFRIFCLFSPLVLLCYQSFFSSVGVCKMYEEHLKRMNPNSPSITYDISQLFDFIDDLADLSCLV